MFKSKSKLANIYKLKLYPVSRPNSLLGQINQYSQKKVMESIKNKIISEKVVDLQV